MPADSSTDAVPTPATVPPPVTEVAPVDEPDPAGESDAVKELRLGLVCYGGSSLAIYMHGVTKEVQRLVKGSALLEAGIDPAPGARSEAVYRRLLADARREPRPADAGRGRRDRRHLGRRDQRHLPREVTRAQPLAGRAARPLVRAGRHARAAPALAEAAAQAAAAPARAADAPRVAAPRRRDGAMAVQRARGHGRRAAASRSGSGRSSRRAAISTCSSRSRISTATTGRSRSRDPRLVHDSRHRHAMEFGYGPGEDQFRREDNGGLAFAARATSCFPGVFPPVSFTAFKEWVPDAQLADLQDRCFRNYVLAGADPAATQFIDGGVLDNKPFGWAIDTISHRRADVRGRAAPALPRARPRRPLPHRRGHAAVGRSRRRRRSRRCSARRAAFPATSRSSTTCSRSRPTTTGCR